MKLVTLTLSDPVMKIRFAMLTVPGDLLVQISVCHVGICVGIGIAPQSTTDPVMKIRFAMLYSTFLSENVFIDNPGRV